MPSFFRIFCKYALVFSSRCPFPSISVPFRYNISQKGTLLPVEEKLSGELLPPVIADRLHLSSTIFVASSGSPPPSPLFPIYSLLSYLVLFIVPDIIRRYFSLYSRRLFCLGHRPSAALLFVLCSSRARPVKVASPPRPSRDHLPRTPRGRPLVSAILRRLILLRF